MARPAALMLSIASTATAEGAKVPKTRQAVKLRSVTELLWGWMGHLSLTAVLPGGMAEC